MSTANVVIIMDEIRRLLNELDQLNSEYEGKIKGVVYARKHELILAKIKNKQNDILGVIKPGAIAQWEITVRTKIGVEVNYIAYPGHYDKNDVLRILEAVKFVDKVELEILDIHKLGIIKLGYLEKINGFQ